MTLDTRNGGSGQSMHSFDKEPVLEISTSSLLKTLVPKKMPNTYTQLRSKEQSLTMRSDNSS
jgi:hypothetical protein